MSCMTTQLFIKMPIQMEAGPQDHMHAGGVFQSRQQDSIQWGLPAMAAYVLCNYFPRRYGDRSFYGRYCCEAFPMARQLKVLICVILCDWTLARSICNVITGLASIRDAVFQSVILPLITFAWKRAYFLMTTVLFLEDNTVKNNGFSWNFMTKILVGNFSVALGGCSAVSYAAMGSFMVADWVLFAFRSCLLLRIGQKQCTKVFNNLLESALSTLVTPLTRTRKSMGSSSALRQMQAFGCLSEGITLSISLMYHFVICYIINFAIAGDEKMALIFRARTVGIPLILLVADMIQDFCSSKYTDKFSSWTLLFCYFTSPTLLPYYIMVMLGVASHIKFKFAPAHIAVTEQFAYTITTNWNVGYSAKWFF